MDFSTMFNTWLKVLTNPREETFQEELDSPRATLNTAVIWMFLAGAFVALVSFLLSLTAMNPTQTMEEMLRQNPDIPPEFAAQITTMMPIIMGGGSLLSVVLAPLFFVIGVGVFYLVGQLLGGKGDFGRYAYLIASFQAPLAIANSLLNFIPVVGVCISFFVGIYQIFLSYLATKVALNLSSGRAMTVVLTPILLILLLTTCLIIFLGVAIFSAGSTAP